MISGIVTAILLLAFLAIAVWAWSSRNRERFAEAASLPLKEDGGHDAPPCCCKERQPLTCSSN